MNEKLRLSKFHLVWKCTYKSSKTAGKTAWTPKHQHVNHILFSFHSATLKPANNFCFLEGHLSGQGQFWLDKNPVWLDKKFKTLWRNQISERVINWHIWTHFLFFLWTKLSRDALSVQRTRQCQCMRDIFRLEDSLSLRWLIKIESLILPFDSWQTRKILDKQQTNCHARS